MTATVRRDQRPSRGASGVGRVARVIGPVVDVEFPADAMPEHVQRARRSRSSSRGETQDAHPRGRPAPRRQHGPRDLDAADRRPGPRRRGARHRRPDHGAGRRRHQGPRVQRPRRVPQRRGGRDARDHRALGHPPPGAGLRPARVQDRDVRDRHQGHRPADARTSRAARSACSAAPASARPCSSRR